ncbi:hypothetical protein PTQ27_05635 [Mannheimia sp. AT1]|uniref:Lipoprotein n=1 Tax=Mannheimia cairinae TaxID=3025936 RepID=A0ABT5MP54_9PAST|nr:hypothetical protein [Mannheimia cairinae]MDD0823945.1 hypothetical protein [Mannheimia cairinae]MDD0825261.1 hypothetical protein [Mannheimia cairinae]
MKLVKFTPALAAMVVLAACSNNQTTTHTPSTQEAVKEVATQATQQVNDIASTAHGTAAVKVESATDSSKAIVYRCQSGKRVTANYVFQGEEAKAVNLVLTSGAKSQEIPTLTRDTSNADFTLFKSDKYMWNVDTGFTLSDTNKTGMLTQMGTSSDEILAKLCDVDKALTSRLNK